MDNRWQRLLHKSKGFRLNFSKKNRLDDKNGEDGEFRINKFNGVSKLYVKLNKKWSEVQLYAPVNNTQEASRSDREFVGNGHMTFSNGLQMCWGIDTRDDDSEYDISFTRAFPSTCTSVVINRQDGATEHYSVNAINITKNKFSVNRHNDINGDITINYLAIGY
tara:strand:- start:290 stop:781 length:492 start_codon:yes stop_codon:yes gene_type:complete